MIDKDINSRINPMKVFFVVAPLIGVFLGALYVLNEEPAKKQVNQSQTQEINIIDDTVQYYKRIIAQKDSVINSQKKILSKLNTSTNNLNDFSSNQNFNEKLFDATFVQIGCITAKFMINKAGSDTSVVNCNEKFSDLLTSVAKFPSAHDCLQKAKHENFVNGIDINSDALAIDKYIKSIISYLHTLKKYSEQDINKLKVKYYQILESNKLKFRQLTN